MEHPQGLDASQKRQRIAQDAGGTSNIPTRNIGCSPILQTIELGGGYSRTSNANIPNLQTMDANRQQLEGQSEGTAEYGVAQRFFIQLLF